MKKLLMITILLLTLTGCTVSALNGHTVGSEANVEAKHEEVNKPTVLDAVSFVSLTFDPSNPDHVYEQAEMIVIASITSIDGTDNFDEETQSYTRVFTYGQAAVHPVLKGEIPESFEFERIGGVIEFDKYKLSQTEKTQSLLSQNDNNPDYVNERFDGDIDIEVNKTYVMYLIQDETRCAHADYCVIGCSG
ncbi:MAG: hypothetical protein GX760_05645 [Erysipelothrix sp.]|nr:hypothetical protein [Erysipelothrix sp.]